MGTTGLIFGGVAVLWLAYLVPWFVRHRDGDPAEFDIRDRLGESTKMIKRSSDPLDAVDPDLDISTPLTRRAALHEIALTARIAAKRRRAAMLAHVLLVAVVGVLIPFTALRAWTIAIPAAMLLAMLVVVRYSARTLRRTLDRRADYVLRCVDEDTVALRLPVASEASGELDIELSGPVSQTVSLWDPIPVTAPSYVQKPLMPRTVRTIDLSAPEPARSVPVTAEPAAPAASTVESASSERPEAVGE